MEEFTPVGPSGHNCITAALREIRTALESAGMPCMETDDGWWCPYLPMLEVLEIPLEEANAALAGKQARGRRAASGEIEWFVDILNIVELRPLSQHPLMRSLSDWLHTELIPAWDAHGYDEPATGHQPPPGQVLDALEFRERRYDLWDEDTSQDENPEDEDG